VTLPNTLPPSTLRNEVSKGVLGLGAGLREYVSGGGIWGESGSGGWEGYKRDLNARNAEVWGEVFGRVALKIQT